MSKNELITSLYFINY